MSNELNYIADLERENRTLKSLLYCTERSCNNCGKVNCENFQRQRKNYCENWVSYKDYIKELEHQIEQLQKINSEQKETLKKVRVALIKERTANIMNYGKGGVEMFDDCFEILKGVSN